MYLLILLYVDDMIITGDNESKTSNLRTDLCVRFEIKKFGAYWKFSWFGNGKIRSKLCYVSKRLCKESVRALWHGGVERKDYSNGSKSQVEEG